MNTDQPKDTGGPAFPQPCTQDGYAANTPYGIAGGGLTMRDWFAGQALAGLNEDNHSSAKTMAATAYLVADAMMKARII